MEQIVANIRELVGLMVAPFGLVASGIALGALALIALARAVSEISDEGG